MRTRAKVDQNQPELVKLWRGLGATVALTHQVGSGFPDVVVGWRGVNYLVEIKDGAKVPSKRKLTPDEQAFHDSWRGSVVIVETMDDAERLINGR